MYDLYNSSIDTWEKQLDDIRNAQKSIYFEQYILEDFNYGEIGKKYLDAIIDSANRGVNIRMILDLQGSIDLFGSNQLLEDLKQAGVYITFYKTMPWSKAFSPIRIMLRNHRKFMVVDDQITWIGGVVIGERFRDWSDLMIRYLDRQISNCAKAEFEHQYERISGDKIILAPYLKMDNHTKLIGNSPGLGNRFCYETISHNLLTATSEVWIATPYFSPPWRLNHIIKRLLQEGVKINLIVPKQSDTQHADWAREIYLNKYIKLGMTIYYYQSMNHAKIVVVDDNWCTIGSTNLDTLSLLANHELNITSTSPKLVSDVNRQMKEWTKELEPITTTNRLVYSNMKWWQKIIGRLARYIA